MPTNKINKHDVDNTIFTENNLPRPDNLGEGVLPVNKGGTGATAFTSGAALIGADSGAVTTRAITK